jgi:hypothetical protein
MMGFTNDTFQLRVLRVWPPLLRNKHILISELTIELDMTLFGYDQGVFGTSIILCAEISY